MFKCSECGNEYEIKPKYCDCGNDIFINKDFTPQEVDFDEEVDDENILENTPRHRNLRKKSFTPVGLGIFGICIILSLLMLFVIGNPKKETKTEIKKEVSEQIEIPSIDSYWDNTAVKITKEEELQPQKQENILDKIVSQIIPQQPKEEIKTDATVVKTPVTVPKKTTTQKPTTAKVQTQKTPQKTTLTQKQTTQKTISKQTSSQPVMTVEDLTNKIRNQYSVQNQTPTQNQQKQTTPQTTTVKQSAPIPQTTSKSTTVTQTTQTKNAQTQTLAKNQTQTNTQTTTTPITTTKSQAQLRQELATYKLGLRNALGRKIDFTKVIGDGECSLSFKINSNGRLTSKAFTKQSSNITLNDAVFNALNTMISYNPPPDGYKGEILRLNIRFYNGNFEISLN